MGKDRREREMKNGNKLNLNPSPISKFITILSPFPIFSFSFCRLPVLVTSAIRSGKRSPQS